ncbi:hypothetical protein K0M31_010760 [Melipona bicolor]|uniref:Uncharacterized protein n=1 Tax=Melipona bicolor TaxID=60889 RepID=A0AA40KI00_9HYME|nr:hypothetical protein K0M31_010760 [Melipona bicolor]
MQAEASTTASSSSFTSTTATIGSSSGNSNSNSSSSSSTVTTSSTTSSTSSTTTTLATPREVEARDNRSSTMASNESSMLDNEIPAKEGVPKHRSKRIRNASEDSGPPRQKRRLLSLNGLPMNANNNNNNNNKKRSAINVVGSSSWRSEKPRVSKRFAAYDDEKTRLFTFKELEAQQQSRSKRFLPPSELDNQIFLKNLYLHAYENEYRANVKRSIVQGNQTNDQQQQHQQQQQQPAVYRRRKGNLDAYEIK